MLDTNVYGVLVEPRKEELTRKMTEKSTILFYGYDVIRTELRATSKARIVGQNLRIELLLLYDKLVGCHAFQTNTKIAGIATEYALNYRGGISQRLLANDFLIVACASVHQLDIVVSEDRHSLLSPLAMSAYAAVNEKHRLPMPTFYSLEEFEKRLILPV